MNLSNKAAFFLLILSLWGLGPSYSQIQGALPDSCARWEIQHWNWQGHVSESYHYTFDPSIDTSIDGKNYRKLLKYTIRDTAQYIGGVRNDSGEVLYMPPDSVKPERLWDFTASVGDTLRGLFGYDRVVGGTVNFYDAIILEKDTQTLDGDSLERFRFELFRVRQDDQQWDTTKLDEWGRWKEIQGSERGLLLRGAWSTVSGGDGLKNVCLSDSSLSFFQYCEDCHCPSCPQDHTSIRERNSSRDRLRADPNPASDRVRIIFPPRMKNDRKSLKLFTLQGKPVLKKSFQDQEVSIDVKDRRNGSYLIKVRTEEDEFAVKRLIVDH